MNINFRGAYFTIQKTLPPLNDNASIILNSSINADIGMPMTVLVHNFLTSFYLPLTPLETRLGILSSISRSALRRLE